MKPAEIDACAIALASEGSPQSGSSWIHLLPAGTFTGRDGRGPYRADDATAIMAQSRELAGRTAIPVDYEHQIDFARTNGQPAPAAGWIKGLQSRADGIWGLAEWTARGAAHLAAREYRYLSPAFTHTADGRVTAILRASLVNNPNLDQLTALASMESRMDEPNAAGLGALRQALELPGDADITAMVGAIGALKTQRMAAGGPDPSQFVPIGEFVRVTQELRRVNQGVDAQAALMHVEEQIRIGRLLPFMKDWGVDLCTSNKPAFDDFVSKTGGRLQSLLGPGLASAMPPPGRGGGSRDLSDTDAHVSAVLGISPELFSKARGN